jgi:endonuclease G
VGDEGHLIVNLKGKHHPDPTFGDVSIPKLFFKIVACAKYDKLAVAAFLMSQEDFLVSVDRLKGMPQPPEEALTVKQARLYQVSVADVASLTGLDFGPLESADKEGLELLSWAGPRIIESFTDILG